MIIIYYIWSIKEELNRNLLIIFNMGNEDRIKVELFDALGHPVRIKILSALKDAPLGFADLKRKLGIESSGHLSFHLGKLNGLIKIDESGNYALTDDGREATRLIDSMGEARNERLPNEERMQFSRIGSKKATMAGLILVLLIAIPTIAYLCYNNYMLTRQSDLLKLSVYNEVRWSVFSGIASDLRTCFYYYDKGDYSQSLLSFDKAWSRLNGMARSMPLLGSDFEKLNITNMDMIDQQLQHMRDGVVSGSLNYNQIEYLKKCTFTFLYLTYSIKDPENGIYAIMDVDQISGMILELASANGINESVVPELVFSHTSCGCAMGCMCSMGGAVKLLQIFNLSYIDRGDLFPYTLDHTFSTSLSMHHKVLISINSTAPINVTINRQLNTTLMENLHELSPEDEIILNLTQITSYKSEIILGKDLRTYLKDGGYTFNFESYNSSATVYFDVKYIY